MTRQTRSCAIRRGCLSCPLPDAGTEGTPKTESEWMQCDDPTPMLKHVIGTTSIRKMRLFLVATARSEWDRMTNEVMRNVVTTAERHIDGAASDEQLDGAKIDLMTLATSGSIYDKAAEMGVTFEVWSSLRGPAHSCGL